MPGSRAGIGAPLLAVLILLSAIAPISIDTYLPSLPEVGTDLATGPATVQLSLTTFLVGLGAGQLVFGPLSDRLGRRRPLLVGTVACAAASLACAFAPTIEVLLAARFVQGAAGAAGVVIARAVIADKVQGVVAARVFATVAAVQGLAPILAPVVGGLLAPLVGWRGIFVLLTLVTTVMAIGAGLLIAETLPPARRSTRRGLRAAGELVVVARDPAVLAPALIYALGFAALFGYIAASPFVLQNLAGLSVRWYSLSFAGIAAGLATSSAVSARLVVRYGPRRLLGIGLAALLGCTAALIPVAARVPLDTAGGRVVLLGLLAASTFSLGQIFGNATTLTLRAAGQRAGAGSALLGGLQFAVGGAASPLVGLGGEGTAVPMALTMTGAAVLAGLVYRRGR